VKGNQALLDQNLALKWINENAARFSGDNSRITIGGERAGSVGYHLIYKASWPYFTNAILQSGNPVNPGVGTQFLTQDQANTISLNIGNILGCSDDLLNCLQSTPAFSINSASYAYQSYPTFVFSSDVFDQEPKLLFQTGNFKKCNILTGFNNYEEFSLIQDELGNEQTEELRNQVLNSLQKALKKRLATDDSIVNKIINFYSNQSNLNDYFMLFVSIITDFQYRCPTYELADYYSQRNQDAYVFSYENKLSVSNNRLMIDEIPNLFAQHQASLAYSTKADKAFREQLIDYLRNFVSNNSPSSNNIWAKFSIGINDLKRNVFFLDGNNSKNMFYSPNDSICIFWKSINITHVSSLSSSIKFSVFACLFFIIVLNSTNEIF